MSMLKVHVKSEFNVGAICCRLSEDQKTEEFRTLDGLSGWGPFDPGKLARCVNPNLSAPTTPSPTPTNKRPGLHGPRQIFLFDPPDCPCTIEFYTLDAAGKPTVLLDFVGYEPNAPLGGRIVIVGR